MQQILGGTYQILNPIGSGSGGTVYKGYHLRLQKYIVLKKFHREIRNKSREMEILKNLHHEALPQVYDFICSNKDTFIVMDYINGVSFKKLLSRNIRFSQEQAAEYGAQLLEVLEYLHTQKIPILHAVFAERNWRREHCFAAVVEESKPMKMIKQSISVCSIKIRK